MSEHSGIRRTAHACQQCRDRKQRCGGVTSVATCTACQNRKVRCSFEDEVRDPRYNPYLRVQGAAGVGAGGGGGGGLSGLLVDAALGGRGVASAASGSGAGGGDGSDHRRSIPRLSSPSSMVFSSSSGAGPSYYSQAQIHRPFDTHPHAHGHPHSQAHAHAHAYGASDPSGYKERDGERGARERGLEEGSGSRRTGSVGLGSSLAGGEGGAGASGGGGGGGSGAAAGGVSGGEVERDVQSQLSQLQGRLRELEAALTLRPPPLPHPHTALPHPHGHFPHDPSAPPPPSSDAYYHAAAPPGWGPQPSHDPSDPYAPGGGGGGGGVYPPGSEGHPAQGFGPGSTAQAGPAHAGSGTGLSPFLNAGSTPSGPGAGPSRPSLSPSTSHPSHNSHYRSSPHHRPSSARAHSGAGAAGAEPLTAQSAASTPSTEREKAHLHGPLKVLQDLGADDGFNVENNDPVARHILTIGEARVACRLFFSKCHPMAPFLDIEQDGSLDLLRSRSIPLFLNILVVGARYWSHSSRRDTWLHPRYSHLVTLLDQEMARLVLRPRPSDLCLETVQAWMVYSHWMPVDASNGYRSRFTESSNWQCLGLAIRWATLLGLDRPSSWQDTRTFRTMLYLTESDHYLALSARKPASLPTGPLFDALGRFLEDGKAQSTDARLGSLLRVAQAVQVMGGRADSDESTEAFSEDVDAVERDFLTNALANPDSDRFSPHFPFTSLRWYRIAFASTLLPPPGVSWRFAAGQSLSFRRSIEWASQILYHLSPSRSLVSPFDPSSERPLEPDAELVRMLSFAIDQYFVVIAYVASFLVLAWQHGAINTCLEVQVVSRPPSGASAAGGSRGDDPAAAAADDGGGGGGRGRDDHNGNKDEERDPDTHGAADDILPPVTQPQTNPQTPGGHPRCPLFQLVDLAARTLKACSPAKGHLASRYAVFLAGLANVVWIAQQQQIQLMQQHEESEDPTHAEGGGSRPGAGASAEKAAGQGGAGHGAAAAAGSGGRGGPGGPSQGGTDRSLAIGMDMGQMLPPAPLHSLPSQFGPGPGAGTMAGQAAHGQGQAGFPVDLHGAVGAGMNNGAGGVQWEPDWMSMWHELGLNQAWLFAGQGGGGIEDGMAMAMSGGGAAGAGGAGMQMGMGTGYGQPQHAPAHGHQGQQQPPHPHPNPHPPHGHNHPNSNSNGLGSGGHQG